MKKPIIYSLSLLISILLLSSCNGLSEREFVTLFNSRPTAVTMPYDNPRYILHSVPGELPFSFDVPADVDLLGTVEADGHESGTILLKVDQTKRDILEDFTNSLTDAAFTSTSESHNYQVFFPPEENGATFCGKQGVAVILEIYESDDGSKDVRLHYTVDDKALERTTCGQQILTIEDFPFPHLAAPPNSSVVGGGGGGGGGGSGTRKGPMGYTAKIVINSEDSLESIYNHYVDLLAAEGWLLLNQSSNGYPLKSDWDFGFYKTRSWLAHLEASVGEDSNQYIIELSGISP